MPSLRALRRNRDRLVTAVVLALALAGTGMRLAWHGAAFADDPLQGAALLDTAAYDQDAALMAAEGPWEPPVSYRPPGYPWMLAAVRALGGGARAVTTLQALLDLATTLLLARLGWLLTRRRALAVAAAFMAACHPVLIYFSGERLETTWAVFWVTLHLWTLMAAVTRGGGARWAGAGATLGVAALIRPNLLAWLPFLVFGAWRSQGRRAGLAALAACALLILPVTAKNLLYGGQFVLVSANGGVNLWLGNVPDPEIQGRVPYYEHLPGPVAGWLWNRLEQRAEDAGAETLADQSSWFASEAVGEMLGHPLRTAGLLGLKTLALVNRVNLSNNRDLYRSGSPLRFPLSWLLSWALLLPLLLVGLWSPTHRIDPRWRWIAAFTGVLALSVVLFFVSGRHRAPLLPPVFLLVLAGMFEFASVFRGRTYVAQVVVLLMVGSFPAAHDWFSNRELYQDYEIDPVGVGNLWMKRSRPAEAEAAYLRALERIPEDTLAMGNLAALRIEQNRYNDAGVLLREALAKHPDDTQLLSRMGLLLLLTGRPADAMVPLDRAAAIDPQYGLAEMNRGRALYALERWEDARKSLERALKLLGNHRAAPLLRGMLESIPPSD